MPQITQLSAIFFSQLFWLAVVFGIIFFGIGRGMLPKIQSTVDARENKISGDLQRAQAARAEADATEAAWRKRMDEARAEAARLSQEAKQSSARDTEERVKAAGDQIASRVAASEGKIRDAVTSARSEIEAAAADITREMVQRLTGLSVESSEAATAVKAAMHG